MVRKRLPLFLDFVPAVYLHHSGSGQYLDLGGTEKVGLVNPLSMEPSLAAYLARSKVAHHASDISSLSGGAWITDVHWTYFSVKSELPRITSFMCPHYAAFSLGSAMASRTVAQRHLWLTISDVPDRDRAVYLDKPMSAEGLFGHDAKPKLSITAQNCGTTQTPQEGSFAHDFGSVCLFLFMGPVQKGIDRP